VDRLIQARYIQEVGSLTHRARRFSKHNRRATIGELLAATLARNVFLNRRAWNAAVRTEYAAMTLHGPEQSAAAGAIVEELAGVGRHRLDRGVPAIRADDGR
jgi:hypothetical protein